MIRSTIYFIAFFLSIQLVFGTHKHVEYLLLDKHVDKLIFLLMFPRFFQVFLYLFQNVENFWGFIRFLDFISNVSNYCWIWQKNEDFLGIKSL